MPNSRTMTLLQVIKELEGLPEEATLFVQEPWSATSECIVHIEVFDGPYAPLEERYGMRYFLEVHIVKELMEPNGFGSQRSGHDEVVKNLIHYAKYDA